MNPIAITAATTERHGRFLTGLLRSFITSNKSLPLVVVADAMLECPPETQWPLRKLWAIEYAAQRLHADPVIWLDSDLLVFADILARIEPHRPCVIGHGARDQEAMIPCGKNVAVRGTGYLISGMFSIPRHMVPLLMHEARSYSDWYDGSGVHDQSALNRMVMRSGQPYFRLDRIHGGEQWNMRDFGEHHAPWNAEFCSRLVMAPGGLHYNGRKVAVLYWVASSLQSHIDGDFGAILDPAARDHLRGLYAD